MKSSAIFRQGDLSFRLTQKKAQGLEVKKDRGGKVLAYGELTGHCHIIRGNWVKVYDEGGGDMIIESSKPFEIRQEDSAGKSAEESTDKDLHKTIILPAGRWLKKQEREFDPFTEEINRVVD